MTDPFDSQKQFWPTLKVYKSYIYFKYRDEIALEKSHDVYLDNIEEFIKNKLVVPWKNSQSCNKIFKV